MVPSSDGLVGRVFGGYQLQRVIGSGGAGTVYLAAKVDAPERQVAVKVLLPAAQATPADLAEFKTRFGREAKALELVLHPHVLTRSWCMARTRRPVSPTSYGRAWSAGPPCLPRRR